MKENAYTHTVTADAIYTVERACKNAIPIEKNQEWKKDCTQAFNTSGCNIYG